MSSPSSAMMSWAVWRPIPATSSKRSTAGRDAARTSPVWGRPVRRGRAPARAARWRRLAASWWVGGGALGDRLLELGGELLDLLVEGVDLVQQHPGHHGVVLCELAGQGLHQRRVLDTQPTPGQLGQCLGVALTRDQRLQHGPARHPEAVGGHPPQLAQGVRS
jgi:hypothetical protein